MHSETTILLMLENEFSLRATSFFSFGMETPERVEQMENWYEVQGANNSS